MPILTKTLVNYLIALFISSAFPAISFAQHNNTLFKLKVLTNSSISIKGSSNINKFNCTACTPFKNYTIQGSSGEGKTINLKGSIIVPIKNFDCNNRVLNKDLQTTLKATDFPRMTIYFIDIERIPVSNVDENRLKGRVEIELAGKRRLFTIQYIINRNEENIRLEGCRSFTFNDFELTPPKKLGGVIKVNDNFTVNFSLYLEKEN